MNLVQRTGNSRLSDADWNRTAGSERQIGEKVIVGQLFLVIYDLGLDISGIGKVPRVIIKKGRGVCYG